MNTFYIFRVHSRNKGCFTTELNTHSLLCDIRAKHDQQLTFNFYGNRRYYITLPKSVIPLHRTVVNSIQLLYLHEHTLRIVCKTRVFSENHFFAFYCS